MNDVIIIPRNLVHGKQAKLLIQQKKALPLSKDMGFLNFEIQSKYKSKDYNTEVVIKDLSEISIGDPVVHENHGVGRYQGLVQLDMLGSINEFLLLTYEKEDKLYVPVTQLNSISRYTGGPIESAPLHNLVQGQGKKEKEKGKSKKGKRENEK